MRPISADGLTGLEASKVHPVETRGCLVRSFTWSLGVAAIHTVRSSATTSTRHASPRHRALHCSERSIVDWHGPVRPRPLPAGLTAHSLRRTFASLLFAIGEPPPRVMGQMGHTTPALTLAIYACEMDRRDGEPERLKALVNGEEWAPLGTNGPED